jgi:diphthine-ammonia ligase
LATQVDWWLGPISFLGGEEKIDTKVRIAWDLWEKVHQRTISDEDEEDEPTFDAWDLKYGHQAGLVSAKPNQPSLPHFEVVEGSLKTPPFLAVQVDELPRISDVEWQCLGLRCEQVTLSERIEDGRRSQSSSMKDGNVFSTIEIDLGQSGSGFGECLQHVIQDHCANMDVLQAVIYTAYPVPQGLWRGQIVPCKSVWGARGRQLAAGITVHAQHRS